MYVLVMLLSSNSARVGQISARFNHVAFVRLMTSKMRWKMRDTLLSLNTITRDEWTNESMNYVTSSNTTFFNLAPALWFSRGEIRKSFKGDRLDGLVNMLVEICNWKKYFPRKMHLSTSCLLFLSPTRQRFITLTSPYPSLMHCYS